METSCISEATDLIQDSFPDDWWKKYAFENEVVDDYEKKKDAFKNDVEELKEKIFDLLNFSLLKGEYVFFSDLDEILKGLLDCVNKIPQFMPPDNKVQELINDVFNENLSKSMRFACNAYLGLHIEVNNRFKIDHRNHLIVYNRSFKNFENSTFSEETLKLLLFLSANINIAHFDHFLTPSHEDFERMLELSDSLTSEKLLGGNKYSLILKQKCDFLICKWIVRRQHLNESPILFVKDNSEEEITTNDFKNQIFPYWRKYIETHYELVINWRTEVRKDFDIIKHQKVISDLSLKELHRLTKYYKDIAKSYENLKEIREELERRSRDTNLTKDFYYTYAVTLVYVINNEFSLLLEQNSSSKEQDAEALYSRILQIQESNGIKNFFAQYKYLGYLVGILEELHLKKQAKDYIGNSRKIIDKCEEIFKVYQSNVAWSESNYNYVYQLPFKECLIPLENDVLKELFIASSFLLPLSKEKYKKEFEENRNRVTRMSSAIEIFENLEGDLSKLSKLSEEIQNKETRTMEILGIFTALISFVAASLPTFKFINSPLQASLFILALGSSFAGFVILLLVVFRGIDKLNEFKRPIGWFIAFTLIFWSLLVFTRKDSLVKPTLNDGDTPTIKTGNIDIKLSVSDNDTTLIDSKGPDSNNYKKIIK